MASILCTWRARTYSNVHAMMDSADVGHTPGLAHSPETPQPTNPPVHSPEEEPKTTLVQSWNFSCAWQLRQQCVSYNRTFTPMTGAWVRGSERLNALAVLGARVLKGKAEPSKFSCAHAPTGAAALCSSNTAAYTPRMEAMSPRESGGRCTSPICAKRSVIWSVPSQAGKKSPPLLLLKSESFRWLNGGLGNVFADPSIGVLGGC